MLEKVIRAIDKYGMMDSVQNVTVALSGGADSVCLLYALNQLKSKYSVTLSAIHVNHMLRGEESDRDENFVRNLCKELDIPLKVRKIDVSAIAKKTGDSIELAARKVRYAAFEETAQGVVATAHSASDNLETVLYNITRGAGLKGVCGIPPVRDNFIRPLIFCTRAEIENYLKEKGACFVIDSTNMTDDYTRNFLRHNVVTALGKINPGVENTVSVMTSNLREDEEFLSVFARKIYCLCLKENSLNAELVSVQHAAVIKRVISIYLYEQHGITVDALHLEKCKEVLLSGGRTGLYAGYHACCLKGNFFVESNDQEKPQPEFSVEISKVNLEKNSNVNNLFLKNAIDYDKIDGSLQIRTRISGDEIKLRASNCTKSLKKLFNEKKIPIELRDVIPVISDDSGVVWI